MADGPRAARDTTTRATRLARRMRGVATLARVAALALAAVLALPPRAAAAHPGGVDAHGCHVARATGVRHCHPERARPRSPAATPATTTRPGPRRPATGRPPIERSAAAVRAFRKANPCPATRKPTGPCPGWEVDHVIPLACGGPDTPANMQWLTREANRKKGAMGCRRR